MATWKKVITSGSAAELSQLNINSNQQITALQSTTYLTGSFTGSFIGDGTNLTGVTATAVFPTIQTTPILSTTKIFSNDGATNTYVFTGQITASTYAGVTGDITIGTDGTSAIGSGVIVNGDINASAAINYTKLNYTGSTILSGSNAITIAGTSTALGGTISQATILAGSTVLSGSITSNLTGTGVLSGSNAITIAGVSTALGGTITQATILASSGVWSGSAQLPSGIISSSATGTSQAQISLNGVDVNINGLRTSSTPTFSGLNITNDVSITGNLSVAGTASFTNTDNLNVKDKFILINSGSSTLADSGWITQYNVDGSGSAFYLEASSTGTYGRFAVAYDAIGTSTSITPDEYVVTARVSASAATPANPTWGGSSNGSGNMYINSLNGDIYIYA